MVKYIIIYCLLINVISFIFMRVDKIRAKRGEWRIKEATLWWLAIVGGAVGGFAGMRVYRHKTKHTSFKIGFPVISILQLILFIYLINQLA
ncbi:DUF1294 domain-containing protein [Metabacillus sp. KUDC1714]|uniref:DUF1294 domain-containing protein n=1 Tax=Metabacillus elymi TaxID=2745198 RepID=A0ABX6S9X9_9BACI|nr:DUF1294 domain-containing protein [Metabacillus litoralis]QNF30799.1 DUF1294 domain-containing protein [Metabacillus sp. KUDC1714]